MPCGQQGETSQMAIVQAGDEGSAPGWQRE